MSTATAAVICSVAGGAFELAGLALVAVGIRDDRKRATRLFNKPLTFQAPTRSYPPRMSSSRSLASSRSVTLVGLQDSVGNALIKLRKALDEQEDEYARQLHQAQVDGDNELRERLRDVLTGSIRGRVLGAGCLAVGIVLSVSGSVLSTMS